MSGGKGPVLLVATLIVRPGAEAVFREFETRAAAIMTRHGGRIEQTIVLRPAPAPTVPEARHREVHLVFFPDENALAAYRADADLAALAALRDTCVEETIIVIGEPGPDYHGLEPASPGPP